MTTDGERSLDPADVLDLAGRVIDAGAAAVSAARGALSPGFVATAAALAACPGKVLVTGSGTSGTIGQRAAHLLSVGGTPAFFLSPSDGLHGGLGVLRGGDMVLAISKGGSSAELNDFCARARQMAGALAVVTASPDSELAGLADHVIVLDVPEAADLGTVLATGSSLAAAAVTDALVEVSRQARGYDWSNVLFTHPSGAVGRDAAETLRRLGAAASGGGG